MDKDHVISGQDLYQARHEKPGLKKEVLKTVIALSAGALLLYVIALIAFVL